MQFVLTKTKNQQLSFTFTIDEAEKYGGMEFNELNISVPILVDYREIGKQADETVLLTYLSILQIFILPTLEQKANNDTN